MKILILFIFLSTSVVASLVGLTHDHDGDLNSDSGCSLCLFAAGSKVKYIVDSFLLELTRVELKNQVFHFYTPLLKIKSNISSDRQSRAPPF